VGDSRNCQTLPASPAEPGGLPIGLGWVSAGGAFLHSCSASRETECMSDRKWIGGVSLASGAITAVIQATCAGNFPATPLVVGSAILASCAGGAATAVFRRRGRAVRLAVATLASLYVVTVLATSISSYRSTRAEAIRIHRNELERDEARLAACRESGKECLVRIRPSGPLYTAWTFPIVPGVSVTRTGISVGVLASRTSVEIVGWTPSGPTRLVRLSYHSD